MENLISTLIAASVLILMALCLLAISYFITGKSRLKPGACGRAPFKNKDGSCGTESSCELCKKPEEKDEDKDKDKDI
ncbi:MAG TPA: hypothetical protein PLC42_04540 [Parachlamydiaceae bacterium]|nr:hypothetical protein [Parachlamydiaceae bacterium]